MRVFKKINKKFFLYAVWYSLITFLAILIYRGGLGDNTQGAMCVPYDRHYGKIYQWVWEGVPCVYSLEFYFGYYILMFFIYIIFDVIRKKIIKFNPSYLFRICEGLSWFVINYVYLLWITRYNYGNIDFAMCLMAFVGVSIFFLPLFLISILLRKISPTNYLHKDK
ncbi:MAG: hypothetical protein IJZ30_02730 [Alphaproteobacteria bacterium]|nr:hypothetical protein [Alphaproteobacteria bacterium]